MNIFALCSAAVFFLVSPSPRWAQNTGRIDCPRNDGYVYLYSSIVTMDVPNAAAAAPAQTPNQ